MQRNKDIAYFARTNGRLPHRPFGVSDKATASFTSM